MGHRTCRDRAPVEVGQPLFQEVPRNLQKEAEKKKSSAAVGRAGPTGAQRGEARSSDQLFAPLRDDQTPVCDQEKKEEQHQPAQSHRSQICPQMIPLWNKAMNYSGPGERRAEKPKVNT